MIQKLKNLLTLTAKKILQNLTETISQTCRTWCCAIALPNSHRKADLSKQLPWRAVGDPRLAHSRSQVRALAPLGALCVLFFLHPPFLIGEIIFFCTFPTTPMKVLGLCNWVRNETNQCTSTEMLPWCSNGRTIKTGPTIYPKSTPFFEHNGHVPRMVCSSAIQWRSHWGGKGGRVPPLTAKHLPKSGKKRGKSWKSGKNQEKWGKRKNREETTKIGKFLSLCPSWQIGLATLLLLYRTLLATIQYRNDISQIQLWIRTQRLQDHGSRIIAFTDLTDNFKSFEAYDTWQSRNLSQLLEAMQTLKFKWHITYINRRYNYCKLYWLFLHFLLKHNKNVWIL